MVYNKLEIDYKTVFSCIRNFMARKIALNVAVWTGKYFLHVNRPVKLQKIEG